jgi:hypothetical protein
MRPVAGALSLALLLLAGLLALAAPLPAGAQTDDSTPEGTDEPAELPTCATEVAGLPLATTLDFADVARPLAPEGSTGDPTGDIASYQLYCPYGELPPSAPSDAAAPLELLLAWAVVPTDTGPGCVAGGESDADGTSGIVGDPELRAQVDWAITDDGATEDDAIAAAEELLAQAPSDTVECDEQATGGSTGSAAAEDDDSSTTRTPVLVIGAAAVVGLLALIVLLVRRRKGSGEVTPPEGAEQVTLPVGPAVGPSPAAGPLVAGAAVPQRAARLAPEGVQRSRAAAGAGTSARARAVADAARAAQAAGAGRQATTLALVAAAAGTLADADVARNQGPSPDPQLEALAENLRTLARGAARGARRAGTAEAAPPSAQVDALLRATTRLVDAHRPLLSGAPRSEAPK